MKRKLFTVENRSYVRGEIINDLNDNLHEFCDVTWSVLPKPLISDVDIIDILLLNTNGQLSVIKVLERGDYAAPLGKVILDYATLNAQRERLRKLYSHEHIDTLKHIIVKLFIPGDTEQIQRVVSYLSFPVDIYRYRAIMTGGEAGIIVEKIHAHVAEGKRHDYSSIIKIMGENVRSDLSFSHEKVTQENKKVKEVETALEPITVPWQHKGAVDNFFERGKLTEEELIAFFDFEKHINDFNNTHQESTEMERM